MILDDQVAIFLEPGMNLAEMRIVPVGGLGKAGNMGHVFQQSDAIRRPAMDGAHGGQ